MVQLTPEHFEIIDRNKARRHELKKSNKQKLHDLFIDTNKHLNNLANAYNKANNLEFKNLYKNKWFELVKKQSQRIEILKRI
jgi:hypothetical protein